MGLLSVILVQGVVNVLTTYALPKAYTTAQPVACDGSYLAVLKKLRGTIQPIEQLLFITMKHNGQQLYFFVRHLHQSNLPLYYGAFRVVYELNTNTGHY